MNIQQLDDECLNAVLIRLPIKDFFKNARRVSKRFRDATEFSLKHLISRNEPLSLDVSGGWLCSPSRDWGLPSVTLAGIRIPAKALSCLSHCGLLPLVSKVSLRDADVFSEEETSVDFKLQLRAILLKLPCATHLTLPVDVTGHHDHERECVDKSKESVRESNSFRSIAFNAAGLLSQLHTLEIANPGSHSQFHFELDKLNDFALFITFAKHLTRLIVPIPLFTYALKADRTILQQLNSLDLFAFTPAIDSTTCQHVFEVICDVSPELSELPYDCGGMHTHPTTGGCVSDVSVLRRLDKLRSLALNFDERAATAEAQPASLPSVEFLALDLPSNQQHKAMQMLQLAKIGRNLKSLELLQKGDGSDPLPVDVTISHVKDLLVSGELQRLERLLIVTPPAYGKSPSVYELIHEITTIPTEISLRKIEIKETRWFSSCDIFLPSANSCSIEHSEPEIGITYAIAKAENICELCFPMDWSESYLQLEQLVLAMQHGSMKRLIVKVDWHRHNEQLQFGIDKRYPNYAALCCVRAS